MKMKIEYLGHSSFKITHKNGVIVTDPFDPAKVGIPLPKLDATLVLSSHDHFDHRYLEGVAGDPFVIGASGEYEVGGVKVQGFSTFHDDKRGAERGRNTVYLFEAEGVSFCHLGDLGHTLSETVTEEMGELGVLFVPVGGVFTIDPASAAKVVAQLEPKYIIPMHYHVSGMDDSFKNMAPVAKFLEEMGVEQKDPQEKLEVSSSSLPEEPEVVVLKPAA